MKRTRKLFIMFVLVVFTCTIGIDYYLANVTKKIEVNYSITPIKSYEMSSPFVTLNNSDPKIILTGNLMKYVDLNSKNKDFLIYKHNYSFIGNISIDEVIFKFGKNNPLIFSEFSEGDNIYYFASSSVSPMLIFYKDFQYNSYVSIKMTSDLKVSTVQLILLNNDFKTLKQFNYEF